MNEQMVNPQPKAWLCESSDGVNCDAVVSEHARDVYARLGRTITPLYTMSQRLIDWNAQNSGGVGDPMNACNGE